MNMRRQPTEELENYVARLRRLLSETSGAPEVSRPETTHCIKCRQVRPVKYWARAHFCADCYPKVAG